MLTIMIITMLAAVVVLYNDQYFCNGDKVDDNSNGYNNHPYDTAT